MSIYVDPLMRHGWVIRGKPTPSCHMWTDGDPEELHVFAESIGLKRVWFQPATKPRSLSHYDLVPTKRAAAVAAGAIELDRHAAVNAWRKIWGEAPLVTRPAAP